jgi:haloacid dehalogenase superfamily, subfamily IA, variant 3 with third motif having DD or ED/haloacid dehalogenase superfamily, subfamily IA, variant 1 with third motif having Dx(3-4)D or Dx(3-4)E
MSKYNAVIFDLDGTLLHTLEDIGDSVNAVLRQHGYTEHSYEQYRRIIGNGARNLVKSSLPSGLNDEIVDVVLDEYKHCYAKNLMNKTRPYPGITEMLYALAALNIKMSVCSNKHNEATTLLVHKLLPKDVFSCIYGERPDVARKPDPASTLEIAANMGIPPQETLYVGDSIVDMQTAQNAGMPSVGVLWGFRERSELIEGGAVFVIDAPCKLIKIIE